MFEAMQHRQAKLIEPNSPLSGRQSSFVLPKTVDEQVAAHIGPAAKPAEIASGDR
jgi:hypothetical protein